MLMASKKKKSETEKKQALKDTDTLPSEAETAAKTPAGKSDNAAKRTSKKKIIGLMGVEHEPGPPGSTHG
jgi:hypothetical protein